MKSADVPEGVRKPVRIIMTCSADNKCCMTLEVLSRPLQIRTRSAALMHHEPAAERGQLESLVGGGRAQARRVKRAHILLAAAARSPDEVIARNVSVGTSTVYRTKRRFVEEGLDGALSGEPRPGADRKLSAHEEATLVAIACSDPPAGRTRWTLTLLADEMMRLTQHEMISTETIRRRLAEKELKPWLKKMWCIPKVDAEFVARMEDVLDLYAAPADVRRPVVCFDESP
jgi:transposase